MLQVRMHRAIHTRNLPRTERENPIKGGGCSCQYCSGHVADTGPEGIDYPYLTAMVREGR